MNATSILLAAAIGLAIAGPGFADPLPTDQVVNAERAFAHDGKALGWVDAFRKHAAPDAIVFRPGPVNAQASLAGKTSKPDGPVLAWWPLWAGAARSGDLGFTTGAATYDGKPISHYFTIWKKQADGGWKWEFDGGQDALAASPSGPDSDPILLPDATASTGSADKAMAQVKAMEAELAAGAKADVQAAYAGLLSPEARTIGWTAPLMQGRIAYLATLTGRAKVIDFTTLGGEASKAGDLAWTYGEARWTEDGKPRGGHYVRVWQDSREGWKIVFDQLYPDPAPSA